jgi:hypothetical protein
MSVAPFLATDVDGSGPASSAKRGDAAEITASENIARTRKQIPSMKAASGD